MPRELTSRREILDAIATIPALSSLLQKENGTYLHELDLEVIVYGRNYNGKKVGPYARLFRFDSGETIIEEGDWGGNNLFAVVTGSVDIYTGYSPDPQQIIARIQEGYFFGETSVLAGLPRNATVKAPKDGVSVLEITRPGLRLLRKFPSVVEVLDRSYRTYSKKNVLERFQTTFSLPAEISNWLRNISHLRVFGKNHQLAKHNSLIDAVYFIQEGWLRKDIFDQQQNAASCPSCGASVPPNQVYCIECGQKIIPSEYLGKDLSIGVEGVLENHVWPYSLVCTGRTDILVIPIKEIRKNDQFAASLVQFLSQFVSQSSNVKAEISKQSQGRIIGTGIVDASNLLVMDMDLCVRCGNCSLACHKVHGRSRLLREGIHFWRRKQIQRSRIQSILAPAVCMHCKDPECLSGCPTGAIGRAAQGHIDIEPKTCIGCADCATQCPYDAISMVPRKSTVTTKANSRSEKIKQLFRLRLDPLPPPVEETADLIAIKCNLCADTSLNPPGAKEPAYSCELNCPTGALARINPRSYFDEIGAIEGFKKLDQTHAIGKNIHVKDSPKRIIHAISLVLTVILTGLTIYGINKFGLGQRIFSFINMRWITGISGLISMVFVMMYPFRRQIYRKRATPLRYWLLVHGYSGILSALLIFLHGGVDSGGLLTTLLMWSFDVVIFTGIFGVVIYFLIPRLLTRMEEEPLLLDTLLVRRKELEDEITEVLSSVTKSDVQSFRTNILSKFWSFGFLLRQYIKRESFDELKKTARKICKTVPGQDAERLYNASEKGATIARLNSLIYLHRILKVWLPVHVISTSLMLTLMFVHIVQVIYFLWR